MMVKRVIIQYLKRNLTILYCVSFIYSILHGSNVWRYVFNKNVQIKGAFLKHTKIHASKDSKVFIGPKCQMNNCFLRCWGGEIIISGSQTCINNTRLYTRGRGCLISVDSDFSMQGGTIQSVEAKPVRIGSHCMFSGDIEILSGDFHPIFKAGSIEVINKGEEVVVEDNVWLGAHVRLLKGTYIPSHVIVGNSSLVSKKLTEMNSIYAGIPAKLLKTGVDWARSIGDISKMK